MYWSQSKGASPGTLMHRYYYYYTITNTKHTKYCSQTYSITLPRMGKMAYVTIFDA